jgi:UDP-N-acetylmuramoylalanine--D-glutamate ligase
MLALENKNVLVLGLGLSGTAACRLLLSRGAHVTGVDAQAGAELTGRTRDLQKAGAKICLGMTALPEGSWDLAVLSPGIPKTSPLLIAAQEQRLPLVGELELAYQHSLCLNISVTGTNGKTTTTELIERVLTHCHRKTLAAGNIGLPFCDVVEKTRDLDFLTLEVSSFQLETVQYFRPSVAVLMNITPDHLDRYANMADYARAKARIFKNQQPFDWAIVQSEALAQLRSLNASVPGKVITFSAENRNADIYFDRGLLISRLSDWSGPLLNLETTRLRGPHNAENLMAALAVSRVLRLPLDTVIEALRAYQPAPHRCEFVAEMGGVRFINDSKATNLDAVHRALQAVPAPRDGNPNIWLIAGGKDKGFDFHDIGPLLSQRVKGAFLIGETREKMRAAWSLFTPCVALNSLLEAVTNAAKNAVAGDVVLLSPACSSFDQFQNYQHRGEVFRGAVEGLARPTGSGDAGPDHKIYAGTAKQN